MVQNVVVVIVGVELPNVERYIYESGLATRLLDGLTLSDSHTTWINDTAALTYSSDVFGRNREERKWFRKLKEFSAGPRCPA